MGCCPPPPVKNELWTSTPELKQPTFITPGEEVDCYMLRSGDVNGEQVGTTPIEDKIQNCTIQVNCNMQVNEQFKLTPGSLTSAFTAPVQWSMVDPETNTPVTISGLSFNTSTGLLSGTFDPQAEGKTFRVKIMARDSSAPTPKDIDSKSYTMIPKHCKPGTDLVFIHPLPGSRCTSRFGPRKAPRAGASSDHKGMDFAYKGGVTKDVLASCDGKVIYAGTQGGYGLCVTVRHVNGSGKRICDTHYAHLAKIYVSNGQAVSAGTPVGKEGNTGHGTGAHLHFEIRLANGAKTDPEPYLRGAVEIAESPSGDSGTPASSSSTRNNGNNVALTEEYAKRKTCPTFTDPGPLSASSNPDVQSFSPTRSSCKPETTPDLATVKAGIDAVLNRHPELDNEDKTFIHTIAKIESRYDPYAKNPSSSATGLYQFLDVLAKKYYGQMGVAPTCENRCNVEYATEAMVRFLVSEIKPYYTNWQASGQTRIAGKLVPANQHTARYPTVTKACWMYGLIHHDGVGNAGNGIDKQGIGYFLAKA